MARGKMKQPAHMNRWQQLAACLLVVYLVMPQPATAVTKMKLHGYITARVDDRTLAILDDKLELTAASRITGKDDSGEHALTMADLGPGMLLEAEGQWLDRHQFFPEKRTVDLNSAKKPLPGAAYLQEETTGPSRISGV